ncbi:hypothetical protein C7449_11211 [Mycoplana dimorpha]|uniref:Uncharacterized protein n=1 Tax=Mycoplana dimorpha TaxID=28320 RepID=A0A2T5ANT6_MYCDI|nr:hypothetical protein C7449_11211 [Mycoplana dimorpha]
MRNYVSYRSRIGGFGVRELKLLAKAVAKEVGLKIGRV